MKCKQKESYNKASYKLYSMFFDRLLDSHVGYKYSQLKSKITIEIVKYPWMSIEEAK